MVAVNSVLLNNGDSLKDTELLNYIEEITTNADVVQKKVLEEILSQNAATEYLQRYNLRGTTDPNTFKAKVPVVTYEDLKPDIQRIANGDRSPILSAHPVSEFHKSSGTSAGKPKLFPATEEQQDRQRLFFSLLMPVLNLHIPGHDKGKALQFLFVRHENKTPSGITAQSGLTSYYKSEQFKRECNDLTSPLLAILCTDTHQSMYVQMLCGLLQRLEVLRIGAIFPSILLRAISFLQLNWEDLCNDITSGELTNKITDLSVRQSVSGLLKPNPELAEFIAGECSKNDWAGIITRLWPNTKIIDTTVTGAMAQYIPTVEYYGGGLPIISRAYASSECPFGINLRPLCDHSDVSYTIMPNVAYFEFIPISSDNFSSDTQLVDLVDVKVDKEHELVVTTYAGLNRYRIGDILRVTGFYNSSPQFRFIRRYNVVLSIELDKTDEAELQNAVDEASAVLKPYNASVFDYTSNANTKTVPGHYVIYLELSLNNSTSIAEGVMEQCCLAMENALNKVYQKGRAEKWIGPLEIRVVSSGTFEELLEYAVSRGASVNQYKVPRCVGVGPILELLDLRVVSSHFSQAN